MTKSKRSIFRDSAMKHYIQKREKDILPRFIAPSAFVFFWILLGLLMVAGLLAWYGQVPTYRTGFGVILEKGLQSTSGDHQAVALIFLPSNSPLQLHIGLPMQLQIGSTGPRFTSTIERIEPDIISPLEARKRYALAGSETSIIASSSIVVTAKLGPTISAHTYAGSILSAQVQVGSRHLLSLLPGLDSLIGAE